MSENEKTDQGPTKAGDVVLVGAVALGAEGAMLGGSAYGVRTGALIEKALSEANGGKVVDLNNQAQVKTILHDHPETAHRVADLLGVNLAAHGAYDAIAVAIGVAAGATLHKRHQQREEIRRASAVTATKEPTPLGRK